MGQSICFLSAISMRYSRSTNFQRQCLVNSGPFFKITITPYSLITGAVHFSDKRNCSLLKQCHRLSSNQLLSAYGRRLLMEAEIVQPSQPLDIRVACSKGGGRCRRDITPLSSSHWTIGGFHCGESYFCRRKYTRNQRRDAGRGGCLVNSQLISGFGIQPPVADFSIPIGIYNFFGVRQSPS